MATTTTRRTATRNARNSTFSSKRNHLAHILSDGRSYSMTTLTKRLDSPDYAIRGRISELRNEFGFGIDHFNGRVQAFYVPENTDFVYA